MTIGRLSILLFAIALLTFSGCGSVSTDPDGDYTDGDVDGDVTDGDVDGDVTDGDVDGDATDGDVDGDVTDGDTEQETADPCTPNPCEDANKTICTNDGEANAVCSCDDNYEDYGDGTCKQTDPC